MTSEWHDSDVVDQYVAGTLTGEPLDAFEEHILSCAECREAVRLAASARVALRTTPGASPRARGAAWVGLPALAAALVLAVLARDQRMRHSLDGVSPPAFSGDAIRAPGDSATDLVDRGMKAYANGDWDAASTLLGRAAQADSSPGVAFYLGVARLMHGDDRDALAAFMRAREPRGNPYADEALLFGAKTLIRMGRADSALVLIRGAAADGQIGAALRAFGDSLSRR